MKIRKRVFKSGEVVWNKYGEEVVIDNVSEFIVGVRDRAIWYNKSTLFKKGEDITDNCAECGVLMLIQRLKRGNRKLTKNICSECWGRLEPVFTVRKRL